MTNPTTNKIIQKAMDGQEVLFRDIPDDQWDTFWDYFERNQFVTFNEMGDGIVKKK